MRRKQEEKEEIGRSLDGKRTCSTFFFFLKSHRANLSRDVSSNRASEIVISIRVLYIYMKIRNENSWLVPLARVNQILAAMSEQVFFTGDVMRHVCRIGRFTCINIKPILALLWKADRESHHVVVGD